MGEEADVLGRLLELASAVVAVVSGIAEGPSGSALPLFTLRTLPTPPPGPLRAEIPAISLPIISIILAPYGYQLPPAGPETMRTNVSACAEVASASGTATNAAFITSFIISPLSSLSVSRTALGARSVLSTG